MKSQWISLSRRYRSALQRHLQQGPTSRAHGAQFLGRQAVTLGLERRGLNRMHRTAWTALRLASDSSTAHASRRKQAEAFLSAAVASFEAGDRIEAKSVSANPQEASLTRRTIRLAAANQRLKQGVVRHRTAEDALRKSRRHCTKLLRESDQLQRQLRHLTHQLLSAQEAERKKISSELRDEVAQTLLGINVRLLTLQKTTRSDPTLLRKEIASTQRVVEKSVRTINRFARGFDAHKHA